MTKGINQMTKEFLNLTGYLKVGGVQDHLELMQVLTIKTTGA